jgi:hypothetical protein
MHVFLLSLERALKKHTIFVTGRYIAACDVIGGFHYMTLRKLGLNVEVV